MTNKKMYDLFCQDKSGKAFLSSWDGVRMEVTQPSKIPSVSTYSGSEKEPDTPTVPKV